MRLCRRWSPDLKFVLALLLRPDPGHPGFQREHPPDGRHAVGEGGQRQLGGGFQSPDHHTPPHGAWQRGKVNLCEFVRFQ